MAIKIRLSYRIIYWQQWYVKKKNHDFSEYMDTVSMYENWRENSFVKFSSIKMKIIPLSLSDWNVIVSF